MLDWARPLAMADDQALWDQFLVQFRAEYADTQRGDRVRETIDNIKMKGIAIDQYISDFIRLAEDAQYDLGATSTWRFFLRGLPEDVGIEVIKANPQDWPTLRQTAIDATNAWNRINIAFGHRFSSMRSRTSQGQRPSPRPGQQNWQQNTLSTQVPRPQYNSSNAPRNFNNVPVPTRAHERGPTDEVHSKATLPKHARQQTYPRSNASTATRRAIYLGTARSPGALVLPEPNLQICCRKQMERRWWITPRCQLPRPPPPKR